MSEFTKFPSIENHYRERHIQSILMAESEFALNDPDDPVGHWYVTEKVHGTNMSFITDGETVQVCKRSGPIPEDDLSGFYRADIALERNKGKILEVFQLCNDILPGSLSAVQVFGEWAGGGENGLPQVQKGVFYGGDLNFFAFDMKFTYEGGQEVWTNYKFFLETMENAGMLTVPVIGDFEGLEWALENTAGKVEEFQSQIPFKLGFEYDDIPKDNIAEGCVLRPETDITLRNGKRAIIKCKASKWSEKKEKAKKPRKQLQVSDTAKALLQSAEDMVTETRLDNVISKIGPDMKPNAYIGPMAKDIVEELEKEIEDQGIEVTGDEMKFIKKTIPSYVAPFVLKKV